MNSSGLAPLGRAVLVEPWEPPKTKSAIFIPKIVERNLQALEVKVRVLELGPSAYPDEPARCAPGDIVYIAKMSGFVTEGPADGKPYRLVNDRDIFAKVTYTQGETA